MPLREQFAIGDDLMDHIQDKAIPCYVKGYEGSWLTLGYYHSDYTAPRGTAEGLTKTGKKVDTRFKQRQLVEFLKGDLKGNRGYIQNLTSPTSYEVVLDNGKVVDYPAAHLSDGRDKTAVPVIRRFNKGDSVIVMLSDNSRTHSRVVATPDEANYTTVQCVWNGDQKTYFDRAALVYVLPSAARRASLQDIQKGDHLIVVAGDDVKDATRRKPGEILLGDCVVFDCWVPEQGVMMLKLQGIPGSYLAHRFQKA